MRVLLHAAVIREYLYTRDPSILPLERDGLVIADKAHKDDWP
jgi:hypothetical protein